MFFVSITKDGGHSTMVSAQTPKEAWEQAFHLADPFQDPQAFLWMQEIIADRE